MTINAIIVDDESKSQNALKQLLEKYAEEVTVVAIAANVKEAVKLIQKHQPQLVFLDIQMPQENGFALFDYFSTVSFEIIFTTAYSQYAIMALRLAAVDYLLKPIDKSELQLAIQKAAKRIVQRISNQQLALLKDNLNHDLKKIALPHSNGYFFVDIKDIIQCEASRNYTYFYLANDQKILVSKNIGLYENLLGNFNFLRVNRSNIINLNHVISYSRARQGTITLSNDMIIPLSSNRRQQFLSKFAGS